MLHKQIRKKAGTTPPSKRIKRAGPVDPAYPNVSRLADKNHPTYSLRENSLLIPYDKAPLTAPGYKRVGMTVGKTYFSVDKKTFKPNGIITEMDDGLLVAWTGCGRCHSHWSQCKCPDGLMAERAIEYIYDHTRANLAGEEWNYNHPNYQGSMTAKLRQERLQRSERQRFTAVPVTHTAPTPAPRKRLRKAVDTVSEPPAPRRLRKASTADRVMTRDGLDHKALDSAANSEAKALTHALSKKLGAPPPKRLRKRGDPK